MKHRLVSFAMAVATLAAIAMAGAASLRGL
jgi:hypothetical protein